MKREITVSGEINFWMHYRGASAAMRRPVLLLTYAFFILLPGAALLWIKSSEHPLTGHDWMIACLGPVFVLILIPIIRALNIREVRRGNATARGPITWTLNESGLESRGAAFDVKLKWDSIRRAVETRQFFLFYISASSAQLLPKAFATAEQVNDIRELLKQAIDGRAKLRRS